MTRIRALGTTLVACLSAASCGPDPCVPGFDGNDRFHVALVETYTVASSYTADATTQARMTEPACAPPFGRAAGEGFDFKVLNLAEEGVAGASCGIWIGAPYAMNGVGIGATSTGYLPATKTDIMETANEVSVAGCQGVLRMQLISPDGGDPRRAPEKGTIPPAVLLYDMTMDAGCMSLPAPCQQLWVVQITRP